MADYISREIAMSMPWANGQYDHEHANEHFIYGLETYKEWLEYVPAADVRPVVRAKWVRGNENRTSPIKDSYTCSVCGEKTLSGFCGNPAKTNFCPNCGADMREVKADG